ncbi:MAG: hypothetical protein IPH75_01490 [bacterium]|nr:hypothetical protein [bacterium]
MAEQTKTTKATAIDRKHQRSLTVVEDVDNLSEEVRTLALNLAIYLAKAKSQTQSEKLNQMEPDFIKLVNGTVRVVQELTGILNAARNMERMIYDVPSGNIPQDRMETRLRSILDQCGDILATLAESKEFRA